jgi:hypothetical protein
MSINITPEFLQSVISYLNRTYLEFSSVKSKYQHQSRLLQHLSNSSHFQSEMNSYQDKISGCRRVTNRSGMPCGLPVSHNGFCSNCCQLDEVQFEVSISKNINLLNNRNQSIDDKPELLAKLIGYSGEITSIEKLESAPVTLSTSCQSSPIQLPVSSEIRTVSSKFFRNDMKILPQYENLMDDIDLLILPKVKDNSRYVNALFNHFKSKGIKTFILNDTNHPIILNSCLDDMVEDIKSVKCVISTKLEVETFLKVLIGRGVKPRVKVVELVNPPYELQSINYEYMKI